MSTHPLDEAYITSNLFHPRQASSGGSTISDVFDGTLPVDDGVALGYRYYHLPDRPVIVYWHGNGEVAGDYDLLGDDYRGTGAGFMVIDYRGYGWSTGTPLPTKLRPDALKVLDVIPGVLAGHGAANAPLFMEGRSLGSSPAIYSAAQRTSQFKGLIIDSGFADAPALFRCLGINAPDDVLNNPDMPLNNAAQLESVDLPLLVLHGENDTLIPVHHAHELFEASPSDDKSLVIIRRAGHNDLMVVDRPKYFGAIKTFIEQHL